MAASLDNTVTICNSCGRSLAGPVNYCPFCGKPPFQKPVQQTPGVSIVADERGVDADVLESDQIRETGCVVATPPLPPVEPRSENINIDTASDQSKSATIHVPANSAASPPPENVQKIPTSPDVAATPAHELRAGETKKSRLGINIVVALVVVASVVATYKLFSGKSSLTKFAEIKIVSTPKGAAVSIDNKDAGDTPQTAVNLTSGKHTFDFSKKGYKSRSIEISLAEGRNPDVQVTLDKSPQAKVSAGESLGRSGGQPVIVIKSTRPAPKILSTKQAAPFQAKASDKPILERIQDAISLYDSKQYTVATKQLKAILEVVPNNSLAKFYLQKSVEAEGR